MRKGHPGQRIVLVLLGLGVAVVLSRLVVNRDAFVWKFWPRRALVGDWTLSYVTRHVGRREFATDPARYRERTWSYRTLRFTADGRFEAGSEYRHGSSGRFKVRGRRLTLENDDGETLSGTIFLFTEDSIGLRLSVYRTLHYHRSR